MNERIKKDICVVIKMELRGGGHIENGSTLPEHSWREQKRGGER